MKDTLAAVVTLIVKTVLFFLCGMLVVVLSSNTHFAGELPSLDSVFFLMSSFGRTAFFAALFLALVSTHFRVVRRTGKKPLTFVMLFVSAFCILYGGLYGLEVLFPAADRGAGRGFPLETGMITRAGEASVWVAAGEDGNPERLGPVVVMNRKKGAGNFRVYASGRFDAKALALRLSPGDEKLSLADDVPREAGISPFVRFFTDDIAYVADRIAPKAYVDIPALAAVFSVVFFGLSLWALAKLSRWPLFNLWFTLAAVWLVFSGSRFLGVFLVPELLRFESLAWAAEQLPVAFPGFCGLILFLAGLVGESLEDWKREMRYE